MDHQYRCSMCGFSTVAEDFMIVHVGYYHKNDPRLNIKCSLIGCGATFSSWKSFEKHVTIIHPDKTMVLQVANKMNPNAIDVRIADDVELHLPTDDLQMFIAQFLINTRETYRTSHTAVDGVTNGLRDIMNIFATTFLNEIREHRVNGTDLVHLDTVEQIYNLLAPSDLLHPVRNKYSLDKLLVTKFKMIPPEKILLGTREKWERTDTPPFMVLKEEKIHGQYIPFLDTLRNLLLKEDVRHNIDNPIIQEGDVLKTVLHGSVYKYNNFFRQNPNALAIIVNYDDLGLGSPVGPNAKGQKMSNFYWTLGNLHPQFRSKRDVVFLLAIAKTQDVKDFGIDKVLERFTAEINTLQTEGITINVNGREINYKGSILFCPCDTPAAALLGGFKESVSAYRFCRICLVTQDEWKDHFNEDSFPLRDAESHGEHVDIVTETDVPEHVTEFWSLMFGINSESVLASIPNLDITMCLPQDPMHVLLEGVVEVEIQALLRFLIHDRNLFTVDDLNRRMNVIDFDHFKVNKPADITVDQIQAGGKLKQSASQFFSLAHVLPFLISPWLNDDEDVQKAIDCHIRLLQILNVIFAYEIHESKIDSLEIMIEAFILRFNDLYPDEIVQKFHMFTHIPRFLRMYGPGRQQSCMRFEGAHQLFKSIVPVVKSFVNMPYTLAYRHQARLCSRLESAFNNNEKKFLYHGDDISFGEIVLVNNLTIAQLLYDNFENIVRPDMHIMRATTVKRYGTMYQEKSVILLDCSEEALPLFGVIVQVFVIANEVVLVYRPLDTMFFSPELNAYCVQDLHDEKRVISLDNLLFPHPIPVFKCNNQTYVLLLNNDHTEFYG